MGSPCSRRAPAGINKIPCCYHVVYNSLWLLIALIFILPFKHLYNFDRTVAANRHPAPQGELEEAPSSSGLLNGAGAAAGRVQKGLNSSGSLRDRFSQEGYIGPFRLEHKRHYIDETSLERFEIQQRLFPGDWSKYYREQSQPYWFKQAWVAVPELYALATHPQILGILKEVLGPDVMLWGAHLLQRGVGVTHKWHTEVEVGPCNASATLWLGVRGTTVNTSLQVIAHSKGAGPLVGLKHGGTGCDMSMPVVQSRECILQAQKLFSEDGNMYAARAANITGKPAHVVKFNMTDGDFIIFQGQTWHGGPTNDYATRTTAVFQYAHPSCALRQALANSYVWPNALYPQSMPLMRMIAGAATANQKVLNHHYEPGMFGGNMKFDNVNEYVQGNSTQSVPLALDGQKVLGLWRPEQQPQQNSSAGPAHGQEVQHSVELKSTLGTYSTAVLEFIKCAAIKFNFGQPIHGLHRHGSYEELVYVVEGHVIVHRAEEGSQFPVKWVFEPGSLIYHAPSTMHSASCMDRAGCTILQYHWRPVDQPLGMTPLERGLTPLPGTAWILHNLYGRARKVKAIKPVKWAALASGLGLHLHVDEYPAGQAVVLRVSAHDAIIIAVQGSLLVLPDNTTLQAGDSAIIPAGCQLSFTAGSNSSTISSTLKLAMLELHPKVLPASLAAYYDKTKSPWHILQQ